ncbi:MAG TPA: beta-xylosidase, partial [Pseudonocardiaceae bacterium]|nr:beta-xylosidase [Pseudonocardiaceae bacterium]
MRSRNRSGWSRLGLATAACLTLLTACTGVAVKPMAEGSTHGVLPGAQEQQPAAAPQPIALATDHGRASGGVIASGGPTAPYNYAPSVMAIGSQYRMWWCSQLPYISARPGDQILYATSTSPDGPFAAPDGTPADEVFGNSPTGFDSLHTCDPSVIEVNGTFYLYYTGTADPRGNSNAVGLATSTDGLHWVRTNNGAPIVSEADDIHGTNAYGAGQPSALYLNGWFYLMFTDTTGVAAHGGGGQFVLRSADPTFQSGVQALGATGFTPVTSATAVRQRSVLDATTSDWMWVDALNAFAIAADSTTGTTITFWDADFTHQPYQPVVIPGPQSEGPGLVRRADGHAPVSTTDPCGRVPLDVVRATANGAGPTGLAHFGVDVNGLQACQQRTQALTLLDGFAMPAPDRTVDLVVGDRLIEVERRSVA